MSPAAGASDPLILLRLTPRSIANQFTVLTRQIEELHREMKARRAAEKELAKQQRWLQVTLSSISDAVIATDTAGRVVFLNPTASSLTGWTSVDAIGQELESIFTIVNEETRLPVRSPVHRTLEEGIITGLANHTVLISRTGVSVAIDDGAAPIRDEDGQIRGVVLVFHEVTNQRNLERSLREQTQRLLEENRRKDEYLAMLAHELRNPLAAIANALAVLQSSPSVPAAGLDTCQIAEEQLRHLRKLDRRFTGCLPHNTWQDYAQDGHSQIIRHCGACSRNHETVPGLASDRVGHGRWPLVRYGWTQTFTDSHKSSATSFIMRGSTPRRMGA